MIAEINCSNACVLLIAHIPLSTSNHNQPRNTMNALNKLIQERFADITQGASADVYPLTQEELHWIELHVSPGGVIPIGTDMLDMYICAMLENRKY